MIRSRLNLVGRVCVTSQRKSGEGPLYQAQGKSAVGEVPRVMAAARLVAPSAYFISVSRAA